MTAVDLPPLPARVPLKGVFVDRAELAGADLYHVTVRHGASRPPRRRWLVDRALALASAAEVADEFGLPLFDMTGQPEA